MKKKVILFLLSVFILVMIYSFLKFSFLINNLLVNHSDFQTEDGGVYFSPLIRQERKESLILMVDSAIRRNNSFWREPTNKCQIVFCATKDELKKYSNGLNTVSFSSPIGNYTVINQQDADLDIISHELCHIYLWNRIGYRNKLKLPVWFDEGVAMQLDFRSYLRDSIIEANYKSDISWLKRIESNRSFYKSNGDSLRQNYIVSNCELRNWIKKNGNEEFFKMIDLIAEGKNLYKVYK